MEYAIKDSHSVPLILQYPSTFLVLGFLVVEPCNFHMKGTPKLPQKQSASTSTSTGTLVLVLVL